MDISESDKKIMRKSVVQWQKLVEKYEDKSNKQFVLFSEPYFEKDDKGNQKIVNIYSIYYYFFSNCNMSLIFYYFV